VSTCNVPEAASLLKIHENRVLKLIDRGDLPAAKIGRAWVMMERDVIAFAERQIAEQTACRLGVPTKAVQRGRSRVATSTA
jgi:excisionase family DNA binding protein